MAVFKYKGIERPGGKKVSGTIEADNDRAARAKLRKQGVFPTSVSKGGAAGGGSKFSFGGGTVRPRDIAVMTNQLATLLRAGVPLLGALEALCQQLEQPSLREAMVDIRARVSEGEKFSDCLGRFPKLFNNLFVHMVSAGEASGTMETVLERVSEITESQAQLESEVKGAMTYPMIMLVVGISLIIGMLTLLVPKMVEMLLDMGGELPGATQFLVTVKDMFVGYWWLLAALCVGAWLLFKRWTNTEEGLYKWHTFILGLPQIGRLVKLLGIARFSRTLSTLLKGGVPMLNAMSIVENIVANVVLREVLLETKTAVSEGSALADPLERSGLFPGLAVHMIAIGEKTGELENMLERVANIYEREVSDSIATTTGMIQPIMMLVMGGIIGFMMIALMLPMLEISSGGM